jgi:hypothetical protein
MGGTLLKDWLLSTVIYSEKEDVISDRVLIKKS